MKNSLVRCDKAKEEIEEYLLENFPGFFHGVYVLFDSVKERWVVVVKFGLLGRDNKAVYLPLYLKGATIDIHNG